MWQLHVIVLISTSQGFNIETTKFSLYSMPTSQDGAYFGYSIGIRPRASSNFNSSWVLQVGAPRLNITGINAREPGGIFRCRAPAGTCKLSPLDETGNVFEGAKFKELKDEAWIAVSMDFRDTAYGDETVVCGHRFGYQTQGKPLGVSQNHYLLIGVCYVERNGNVTKLTPLRNEDRAYFLYTKSFADYDWGLGLAGISAALGSRGLMLGAPTIYHMTGSVVVYPPTYNDPVVPKIKLVNDLKTDTYAYFGYSVGFGKFFGDGVEWCVMGAPRSQDLRGRVFIFQVQGKGEDAGMRIHRSVLSGKSYGEYFGASIAVTDVNGDSVDDLVVGAPMFARRSVDQGRVYLFIGQKQGFRDADGLIFQGNLPRGRFGTCVSAVGDLDWDGYGDVAVGAPYEGGRGAVYIYRGSPRGLRLSQKLHASDISPLMRGFGISISSGVDVDGDHFPEVGVGAYLSGHAVLLRTKPVVALSLNLTHPDFLDRKQLKFNVTLCISFHGKYLPQKIEVAINYAVDENLNRGIFEQTNSGRLSSEMNVTSAKPSCSVLTLKLFKERLHTEFDKPITLNSEAHLLESKQPVRAEWPPLDAILGADAPRANTEAEIPFSGECGYDNLCVSHLQLKCEARFSQTAKSLRLGTNDSVSIEFLIKNVGEPAKNTKLLVNVQGGVSADFRKRDVLCSSKDNKDLICKLDTLPETAERAVNLELSAESSSRGLSRELTMMAAVVTDSKDESKTRTCTLNVDLASDGRHALQAVVPSTIHLTQTASTLNVTHTYYVDKLGWSPVHNTVLLISIPVSIDGVFFSALVAPPATLTPEPDDDGLLDSVGLTETADALKTEDQKKQSDRKLKNVPNTLKNQNESMLLVSCSNPRVICETVTVNSPTTDSFTHPVTAVLNISALEPFLGDTKVICLETNGSLTSEDGFGKVQVVYESGTSCFVLAPAPQPVSIQTIVLSAVAGSLLYAMIFSALLKQGFFRRKTKEQLDALKTQDLIKERFSMYDGDPQRKVSESAISYKTVAPDYDDTPAYN